MIQHLIYTYRFNLQHAQRLVKDLNDEQMVQQPGSLVNHPAWSFGHLASTSNSVAKALGLESTFPAAWEDAFKAGGTPSNKASDFPSKDEIIAELSSQHERVSEAIISADPKFFARESDEGLREHFPTVGDFVTYVITAHEGTHIGQVAAWRRAMGMGS